MQSELAHVGEEELAYVGAGVRLRCAHGRGAPVGGQSRKAPAGLSMHASACLAAEFSSARDGCDDDARFRRANLLAGA